MADTGVLTATSAATTGSGSTAWSNPSWALTPTDTAPTKYATQTLFSGQTATLTLSSFSASIPSGATIDGIEVISTGKYGQTPGTAKDYRIQLKIAGSVVGDNKADTSTVYGSSSSSPTNKTYGSPTDKWGLTTELTPSNLNASGFSVEFQAQWISSFVGIGIDAIQIKIYYTTGGSTTSVSQTQACSWNASSFIAQAKALSWNNSAFVNQSKAMTWNARTFVIETKAFTWNAYENIAHSQGIQWDDEAFVTSPKAIGWNNLAFVAQSKSFAWNTFEGVSKEQPFAWNSKAFVSASTLMNWNAYSFISQSLAITWDMVDEEEGTFVSQSQSATWNSKAFVSESQAFAWHTKAFINQSKPLTWNAFQTVSRSQSFTWNAYSLVAESLTLTWDAKEFINQPKAFSWNAGIWSQNSQAFAWNIESNTSIIPDLRRTLIIKPEYPVRTCRPPPLNRTMTVFSLNRITY